MASTYSTNLAIELIGTGDQAGSWGNTTNTNLGTLIEQAISGYVTQAVSTGTDTTITIPNGATGVARNMYIELTGTGGASTNLIVPANKKLYFIFNNSTGAVTVKVSGQTGVSVPQGKKVVLTSNGTDIVNGLNYIADFGSNSATITQLTATSATITNLTLTSLVISNLSIASANITTLTGSTQTLSGNLTLSGGTANGVLYLNGSKVATSGSALVFNGTNLGIGVTPSAWSGYKAIQIGQNGAVSSADSGTVTMVNSNCFFDGTNYKYISSAEASLYQQASGAHNWRIAASGTAGNNITFTQAMTLDSSGNLGIGTTSPTSKLDLVGIMQWQATAGTVLGKLTYSGGEPVVLANTGLGLQFFTNNAFAAKIDTSGNLGIGASSPDSKLNVEGTNTSDGPTRFTANLRNSGAQTIGVGTGIAFSQKMTGFNAVLATVEGIKENATTDNYASALVFSTRLNGNNLAERLRIDSSGNLGLGVTPSAWQSASGASWDVIDIGGAGALAFSPAGSNDLTLAANAFYDNTDSRWEYKNTGDKAARYSVTAGGTHVWYVTNSTGSANTLISFTQAMTLDASGNWMVGTTTALGTAAGRVTATVNGGSSSMVAMGVGGTWTGLLYADSGSVVLGNRTAIPLTFETNSTERARITSGGNVGIGTTSPVTLKSATTLQVNGNAKLGNANDRGLLSLGDISSNDANCGIWRGAAGAYGSAGNYLCLGGYDGITFTTGNSDISTQTERARITATGDFFVGTTGGDARVTIKAAVDSGAIRVYDSSGTARIFVLPDETYGYQTVSTIKSNGNYALRLENSSTTLVGGIVTNASGVSYNTTSDYRLKTLISPITDSGERLDDLNPIEFEWKDSGRRARGFFAHEFQQVYSSSVTGEKDAVDSQGKPVYQAMQASTAEVIADLVAEIQSLRSRVAALEAK